MLLLQTWFPGLDAFRASNPGSTLSAAEVCDRGLASCQSQSQLLLTDLSISQNKFWRYGAIGFIAGMAVVFNIVGSVAVSTLIQTDIGTARDAAAEVLLNHEDDPADEKPPPAHVAVTLAAPPHPADDGGDEATSSVLPFSPMTVAWRDLSYSVVLPRTKETRVLLQSVTGLAQPGRMLALCVAVTARSALTGHPSFCAHAIPAPRLRTPGWALLVRAKPRCWTCWPGARTAARWAARCS